jgi:hypothetical protein
MDASFGLVTERGYSAAEKSLSQLVEVCPELILDSRRTSIVIGTLTAKD